MRIGEWSYEDMGMIIWDMRMMRRKGIRVHLPLTVSPIREQIPHHGIGLAEPQKSLQRRRWSAITFELHYLISPSWTVQRELQGHIHRLATLPKTSPLVSVFVSFCLILFYTIWSFLFLLSQLQSYFKIVRWQCNFVLHPERKNGAAIFGGDLGHFVRCEHFAGLISWPLSGVLRARFILIVCLKGFLRP